MEREREGGGGKVCGGLTDSNVRFKGLARLLKSFSITKNPPGITPGTAVPGGKLRGRRREKDTRGREATSSEATRESMPDYLKRQTSRACTELEFRVAVETTKCATPLTSSRQEIPAAAKYTF